MSDHDTIAPETDDEIRERVRAFAQEVKVRTDAEAALERMPRRRRPSTAQLVAIAASFVLAFVIATVVISDRQSVDTVPPADDVPTTLAKGVVRFVEPAPSGCCTPPGGGLALPAGQGLGGQTMDITAVEDDGEVTGEARFTLRDILSSDLRGFPVVVELECADTDTGDVILGGRVTAADEGHSGGFPDAGALMAVLIREGEPDSATVVWTTRASSCDDLLESLPEPRPDDRFLDVVDGDDIETGRER